MIILPVTLTIAGAAALLNIWLAVRAGRVRMSEKVSHGDGGNPRLTARMRAHANFAEYTPFVLILIGAIELARGTSLWLWGIGMIYVIGRVLHAFGMDAAKAGPLRLIGILVTLAVLLVLAGWALYIPYVGFTPTVTEVAMG